MGGQNTTPCQRLTYTPGVHPGVELLPPAVLVSYPTLPTTVLGKISADGEYYDHYGKFGGAFEDSMISAPDGKAKKDYEQWLVSYPEIAKEIDEVIRHNRAQICGEGMDERDAQQVQQILGLLDPDNAQSYGKQTEQDRGEMLASFYDSLNGKSLEDSMIEALQARFKIQNSDKLIHFRDQMEKKSRVIADMQQLPDYKSVFDAKMIQFYKEFEGDNLKIFQSVMQKQLDQMASLQSQDEATNDQRQKQLIEQSEKESDQLTLESFERLSARYINEWEDMILNRIGGFLVNLQSAPALQGANALSLQGLQQVNVQPIQIVNLAGINQILPHFQNMQLNALLI